MQLGWPCLGRSKLSAHRALQQDPAVGVRQPGLGGVGVSKQAGPVRGEAGDLLQRWGQPKAGHRRPHCGSRGCLWKELKNDRNFPNCLFFHSQVPQPPILRPNSEENFEMCQEQKGKSLEPQRGLLIPRLGGNRPARAAGGPGRESVPGRGRASVGTRGGTWVSSEGRVPGHGALTSGCRHRGPQAPRVRIPVAECSSQHTRACSYHGRAPA